MALDNVLITGGSGFIGRHLAAELVRRGFKVTVPARRRERVKQSLILLPTVDVVEANINAPGVLEHLLQGKDAVINLVGVLHGPDFRGPHVELPKAIVAACRAKGVRRLVHMSALGASGDAASEYQRTKALGEELVLGAADLDVSVFRPSVVFGPQDRFLNLFAELASFLPVLAIPRPQARFQPVYVGDVARAIAESLDDVHSHGRRYELGGPRQYTLKELVHLVCSITGRRRLVVGLPDWAAYTQAWFLEHLPGTLMSRDNIRSMQAPNTTGAQFPFAIQPQPLEAVAPAYLGHIDPRERLPQLRWRARR